MKTLFYILKLLFFILFVNTALSQVGINVEIPTEMLDVNGKAKFRDVKTLDPKNDFDILVTDATNIIKKISKTDLEIKKESFIVSIDAGESLLIDNTLKFNVLNIIVQSENGCSRRMISSFSSNNNALVFLNGIARDVVAKVSVMPIPGGAGTGTSASFRVEFPNVVTCSGEGPSQNNFNFSFVKTGKYIYKLTNNGDITRKYVISFQKIA